MPSPFLLPERARAFARWPGGRERRFRRARRRRLRCGGPWRQGTLRVPVSSRGVPRRHAGEVTPRGRAPPELRVALPPKAGPRPGRERCAIPPRAAAPSRNNRLPPGTEAAVPQGTAQCPTACGACDSSGSRYGVSSLQPPKDIKERLDLIRGGVERGSTRCCP
jgi:hypothetical protein